MLAFAQKLPTHDLLFLPRNISEPKVLAAWIHEIERGDIVSLLAMKGETVVGCGTLVRDRHSWSQHVGEIRMVVSQDVRGQGVERALSQETFALALGAGLERSTKGARSRCSKASASRPRRCCGTTSGTSTARPMTSSCLGTMWRKSGHRWRPMACLARYNSSAAGSFAGSRGGTPNIQP